MSRPHVVLICFACEPGGGSEEGVGWAWAKAAASVANVTLLTTSNAAPTVRRAACASDLNITVRATDAPGWVRRLARRKLIFLYYVLWQALAGREVRRLESTSRVDVVHHLTWASDSLPSALLASKAPIRIWGPVGGSTGTAPGLYRFLSPRGIVDQLVRDAVNGTLRRLIGARVARHASLVVALNHDVRRTWSAKATPVVMEPNLALEDHELSQPGGVSPLPPSPGLRTAVFAARLIPWKGLLLAIESLRHAPNWRLVVLGDGPELERATRHAEQVDVSDRVTFLGRVPRADALMAFRAADAMLFPSFHDSAPWAVGEAAAVGCPVVCIDAGGPPVMGGRNAYVVPIEPSRTLAYRLGTELEQLNDRGVPEDAWNADRVPGLLAGWYGITAGRR